MKRERGKEKNNNRRGICNLILNATPSEFKRSMNFGGLWNEKYFVDIQHLNANLSVKKFCLVRNDSSFRCGIRNILVKSLYGSGNSHFYLGPSFTCHRYMTSNTIFCFRNRIVDLNDKSVMDQN